MTSLLDAPPTGSADKGVTSLRLQRCKAPIYCKPPKVGPVTLNDPTTLESVRVAFDAKNPLALAAALRAAFPVDPDYERIDQWVRFVLFGGAPPQTDRAETLELISSIQETQQRKVDERPLRPRARGHSGVALEFLADESGLPQWTMAFFLNQLTLASVKPSRRYAVVATMRDDGIYILEFIAYYLALGFEHVFIYTNDNRDDSDALLGALAEHGIITVIENDISGFVEPEAKAFGHALNRLADLRDFEWVLFVDSDEYLMPAPEHGFSIDRYVTALEAAHPDGLTAAVLFDWLWFVSDFTLQRASGTLYERFEHARPHWLPKTLVRLAHLDSMRCQHHPEVRQGYRVVDSGLGEVDMTTIWERKTPNYSGGWMSHYWPKSFEEFLVKKARGATLKMEQNFFDRPYDKFFIWNGHAHLETRYPAASSVLTVHHAEINRLRSLPGIAALADRIDEEFRHMVASISGEGMLERLYAQHRTEPGPL